MGRLLPRVSPGRRCASRRGARIAGPLRVGSVSVAFLVLRVLCLGVFCFGIAALVIVKAVCSTAVTSFGGASTRARRRAVPHLPADESTSGCWPRAGEPTCVSGYSPARATGSCRTTRKHAPPRSGEVIYLDRSAVHLRARAHRKQPEARAVGLGRVERVEELLAYVGGHA